MTRQCGTCTLCCKLIPVADINKPANTRCRHQRMTGCKIYSTRPNACRLWNCRWLVEAEATADLSRPDRSHYVIDVMPDYVRLRNKETGAFDELPVLQVWCDPAYPQAHRDPALRDYLDAKGIAALVRYGNDAAMLIAPPSVNKGGTWFESVPTPPSEEQHSFADVQRVLEGD